MVLILSLMIGAGSGAFAMWTFLRSQLQQQENDLNRLQRTLNERDREYEARLRKTTESLQQEYQQKLDQQIAQLKQEYAARGAATPAPAAVVAVPASTDAAIAPEPISSPAPAAKEPVAIAPPVDAPIEAPAAVSPAPAKPAPTVSTVSTSSTAKPVLSLDSIPQLLAAARSDVATERAAVAAAVEAIAAQHSKRADVLSSLPVLGQLSRDLDASVRLAAVMALGQISSNQVIPLLQTALRDRDPAVVQAASEAIARYKTYAIAQPKAKPANAAPRQ